MREASCRRPQCPVSPPGASPSKTPAPTGERRAQRPATPAWRAHMQRKRRRPKQRSRGVGSGPRACRGSRPIIGLLIEDLGSPGGWASAMWAGVTDVARERDASLICFVGGILRFSQSDEFQEQRNALYDLVTADIVDGLIVSGSLRQSVSSEEFSSLLDRYRPLPMVGVTLAQEGAHSVLVDNYGGMRSCVAHLIEAHGCRRIAFIRGPEGNEDAEQRYRAYVDVLAEHDLPFAPDLVAPGDFSPSSGAAAIDLLLDERQVDFEAVAGGDDCMALGALEALQGRGVRVPHDVLVAGFDDTEESRAAVPSLTTARQPTRELGRQATEMLLALLAGEKAPEQVVLPTRLIVRQSCGCMDPAVVQATAAAVADRSGRVASRKKLQTVLTGKREELVAEMVQETGDCEEASRWAEQVLDGFAAAMAGEAPGVFLRELVEVLQQVAAAGSEVASWRNVLSVLRRQLLPYLGGEALARADDLWQQARAIVAETAQRVQARRALQARQQAQTLRDVGAALVITFDVEELMDVLADALPRMGIPSAYLALYENPQPYEYPQPAPEWSRFVLVYDEGRRVALEPGGRRFPSRQLMPLEPLLDRQYTFVVEPLYHQENQLGFVLFEVGPREGYVYSSLRAHIGSAVRGALLTQQVRKRALQLQTAAEVAHSTISVLDPDELLHQV
ncbi:MAG: LacI family transcriptional regulator, partial [Anaerolineales bacterium]